MPVAKPATPILSRGHPHAAGLLFDAPLAERGGTTVAELCRRGGGTYNNPGSGSYITGPHGPALAFNGSNQNVRFNQLLSHAGGYTVAFWIRGDAAPGSATYTQPVSLSGTTGIFSWDHASNGYKQSWSHSSGGTVYPVQIQSVLAAGVWYHVAVTYDLGTATIAVYLNGKFETSGAGGSASPVGDNNPPSLGASIQGGATGSYWAGSIGGLAYWGFPMRPSQIASLYADHWAKNRQPPQRSSFAASAAAYHRRTLYDRAGSRGVA